MPASKPGSGRSDLSLHPAFLTCERAQSFIGCTCFCLDGRRVASFGIEHCVPLGSQETTENISRQRREYLEIARVCSHLSQELLVQELYIVLCCEMVEFKFNYHCAQ
jgi:hypothetical protein